MDPITAAIVATLPALAAETAKSGVKDAYKGLKAVIRRKWGDAAPISKAVAALEEDPSSMAQAAILEEKVGAVRATEEADVMLALTQLVEHMKTHRFGGESVADIKLYITGGTQAGVLGAQNVSANTITFGKN